MSSIFDFSSHMKNIILINIQSLGSSSFFLRDGIAKDEWKEIELKENWKVVKNHPVV